MQLNYVRGRLGENAHLSDIFLIFSSSEAYLTRSVVEERREEEVGEGE